MIKEGRLITRTLAVLAFGWMVVPAPEAHAITAWGRKYGMSCSGCHTAGYKLNGTGQKFLRAGHKMGESDMKGANLSDYAALTGKLRSTAKYTKTGQGANTIDKKEPKSSFQAHAFSLYTGGPLDKGFSYFGEFYLSENESKSDTVSNLNNETTVSDQGNWARGKLAEMYLQYHKTFNEDAFVSVRMGRIMPTLVHFNGGGARLEYSRPLSFTTNVGSNPYRAFNRQYGWSLASSYKDLYAEFGLVNGTGKNENAVEVETDSKKDFYGTLDYRFDMNGSMIGAYFYKGYYPLHWFAKAAGGDRFYQYGLLGNYTAKFNSIGGALVGSMLWGNDRYVPTGDVAEMNHRSMTYYAEAQGHFLDGDVAPYAKWEYFDTDTASPDNEKFGPALGIHVKPFEHGRFVLEYSRYLQRTSTKKDVTSHDLTLELQYMF